MSTNQNVETMQNIDATLTRI